jgi:hypothetical protein
MQDEIVKRWAEDLGVVEEEEAVVVEQDVVAVVDEKLILK